MFIFSRLKVGLCLIVRAKNALIPGKTSVNGSIFNSFQTSEIFLLLINTHPRKPCHSRQKGPLWNPARLLEPILDLKVASHELLSRARWRHGAAVRPRVCRHMENPGLDLLRKWGGDSLVALLYLLSTGSVRVALLPPWRESTSRQSCLLMVHFPETSLQLRGAETHYPRTKRSQSSQAETEQQISVMSEAGQPRPAHSCPQAPSTPSLFYSSCFQWN